MHDLVIRGGMVVDGTGAGPVAADVAVEGDTIVAVGPDVGRGRRTLDADGRLVTPGFVDLHTHLDAQLGWDPLATSSCWHGVTSLVIGNCGVTFAPVRAGDAGYLARMMESVEDIPADSILAGLPFSWESYGQYLDWLGSTPKGVNVGGMVGHCAVRYHAMGERSLDPDAVPTDAELAVMVGAVDEAMAAGALGFSTSRTRRHVAPDGRNVPGTWATETELVALADAVGAHGRGFFGAAPRFDGDGPGVERARSEVALMAAMSRTAGRPFTFNLTNTFSDPDLWRQTLGFVAGANAAGARLRPQTTSRGIGVVFSLDHATPFDSRPGWEALSGLDARTKAAAMTDPDVHAALVAEGDGPAGVDAWRDFYVLTPERGARYDCDPASSLAAHAERAGTSAVEAYVDLCVAHDGQVVLNWPVLNQDFGVIAEMLTDPLVMMGLADAGAHVGQILDASQPTFFLSYWVRERGLVDIGEGVRRITSDTAAFAGLTGRGVVRPGARADLNVVDLDALHLPLPQYVRDFPGDAGRFVQRAEGYGWTLVNGQVFMEDGRHTGVLAGRPLRAA
ncbi:N-acyl-D-amino-acid deacylase family protein [Rhabdothermincola salaria]|uniref:N-acyl-D-amino-acid deacylase family protein n=1 Tax=Rhabdothermincola salaria TaxID=2903142 RepID=UPI001E6177A2|nr:amidohydrolase family protein [Rhabdothermincola salaria]MCD9625540.1 amidohydrolase family protein [Rhabdothermincola salaria]